MKLPELKTKFKNKYVIRIIAGVLVVAMVGTGASALSVQAAKNDTKKTETKISKEAEDTQTDVDVEKSIKDAIGGITINEKEIGKEETVYLIADSTGTVKKNIVSDHLLNNEDKKNIEDVSTLKDIENVKGDETFTQKGDKITWAAEGNDIYYQGTTDKEAPVSEKITYYLDGKEIAPKDLAGKSGKVTIRFDYSNHEKVEQEIAGKKATIYVPFLAVTGLMLDESFTDIEVTNGKVMADGNTNMVLGYALPGLKDSLNVDEKDFDTEITIPEYFEITANVEDFELGTSMTAVVNATNFIDANGAEDTSAIDDLLDSLTDATTQLQDGSAALANGVDTLQSNLGEFSTGMNTLADGIATLKNGTGTLANGANTLKSSAKSISDGIATLDKTLNTPLTDQEKAAYSEQAAATVNASFAQGTDTYNYIFSTAKQSFSNAMSGSTDMIYQSLRYNADGTDGTLYCSLYQAVYAQKLEEAFGAWLQQNAAGMGIADVTQIPVGTYQTYKASFEASAQAQIAPAVQAGVEDSLKTLAASITGGIAAQGADTTAASVVDACKTASVQAASSALVTGIESTKSNIAASIEAKQSNGYSLVSGAAALAKGTEDLAGAVPELVNGVNSLNDGAGKLKDGTGAIVDGVNQLGDGAHELADGIVTFNDEGIEKILNSYNGDIEPLMTRIQAVLDAGSDYQIFTDAAEGVNGSVKFIYKTDAVKVEK